MVSLNYYNDIFNYGSFDKIVALVQWYMTNDLKDPELAKIKHLLTAEEMIKSEGSSLLQANLDFFLDSVNQSRYDLKPRLRASGYFQEARIRRSVGTHRKDGLFVCCPIRGDKEYLYYYDIWSNIYWGYLGTSAGFISDNLHNGNGIHNFFSGRTGSAGKDDQLAVKIGIDLYTSRKEDITVGDLESAVKENSSNFTVNTTKILPEDLYL